jgi:hypothetical protein
MNESPAVDSPRLPTLGQESLYFCGQHGVMDKSTDLKDKADRIAERA